MLAALGAGLAAPLLPPLLADAAAATRAAGITSLSGLPWLSGGYSDVAGLVRLRGGKPLDVVTKFTGRSRWSDLERFGSPYVSGSLSRERVGAFHVSYPLFPDQESPKRNGASVWKAAAAGRYDRYHDNAARSIAGTRQRIILRIGWEWNLTWSAWSCTDTSLAPHYIGYFRRVVDRFRARLPNVVIDWNSNRDGRTNGGVEKFYPGDDWVDFIGIDAYDWWPKMTSQAAWNGEYNKLYNGGPRGIGSWLAFAKSRGKKLSVGEWGVIRGPSAGGGDNPLYISLMLSFFRQNAAHIGYEAYFNKDVPPLNHHLADNPKAAAAYGKIVRSI